jgi:hypothetical protein
MMDRLNELAADLSSVLEQLQDEAIRHDARELMAPLAWLDEANGWLAYEMAQRQAPVRRDPVPFTYIPVEAGPQV